MNAYFGGAWIQYGNMKKGNENEKHEELTRGKFSCIYCSIHIHTYRIVIIGKQSENESATSANISDE